MGMVSGSTIPGPSMELEDGPSMDYCPFKRALFEGPCYVSSRDASG